MGKNKKSRINAALTSVGRNTRRALKYTLIAALVVAPITGISTWTKWAYQVKTNYGAVITEAGGDRVAVTEPGWHIRMPFLSTYEKEYALANQILYLRGKTTPQKIITKGSNNILAKAFTRYKIIDLRQYAIENVKIAMESTTTGGIFDGVTVNTAKASVTLNADSAAITIKDMIQSTLDSKISNYIQKTEAERMLHDKSNVEKEILEELVNSDISKTYGIRIEGFYLPITEPLPEVVTADAEGQAKAVHAKAEAAYYKKIEGAFDPQTPEEKADVREKFENMVKYRTMKEREGDTAWILEGKRSGPVFNPQKRQPLKDSEKQHE